MRGKCRAKHLLLPLAVFGVIVASSQPASADPVSRQLSAKHRLIMCMTKQMSESRTISYNEATKVCKAQPQAQASHATLASSAAIKPSTAGLNH